MPLPSDITYDAHLYTRRHAKVNRQHVYRDDLDSGTRTAQRVTHEQATDFNYEPLSFERFERRASQDGEFQQIWLGEEQATTRPPSPVVRDMSLIALVSAEAQSTEHVSSLVLTDFASPISALCNSLGRFCGTDRTWLCPHCKSLYLCSRSLVSLSDACTALLITAAFCRFSRLDQHTVPDLLGNYDRDDRSHSSDASLAGSWHRAWVR